jgi:predicted AlkP superfamily pyrophosphatase or phosphodiesterase
MTGRPGHGALLALFIASSGLACAPGRDAVRPTVILISLDGFRFDYVDRRPATTIRALAARGVRAEGLIPIFPTKTFPNHYAIVTGLTAEHHGIVANNMYDPDLDARYGMADRAAVGDARWYGGEPIWVTAERAGQRTAPLFWPGSEAAILGHRPWYWRPFVFDDPPSALVQEILQQLDRPTDERPTFLTLYFHETDDQGHDHGTTSPQLDSAIAVVDRALADLIAGLADRRLLDAIDIIVVSDHGMTDTSRERVILLDDLIDLDDVTVSDWNPVAALWPDPGKEDLVRRQLGDHDHLTVYRKDSVPLRLGYRNHRRIAPLLAVADPGWVITTRSYLAERPDAFDGAATHGYDPAVSAMHGLLVAAGPSFRRGVRTGTVANVHLYEMMAAILRVTPAPNDGTLDSVVGLLAPGVATR